MSLQKQKIVASAMKFFAERGYAATSIQDIANDCGIAKGSVYKFFASKEDLFIEVYKRLLQSMHEEAERIKADPSLTTKERFMRETWNQFLYFAELKTSIQQFYELPINPDSSFTKFSVQMRAELLVYYEACIIRAYGPAIEPNKWDMVALYVGILKEYMVVTAMLGGNDVDYEHMAAFVVDRMDEMAAGILRSVPEPILNLEMMTRYDGMNGEPLLAQESVEDVLARVLVAIQELQVPNARKTELHEAATLLGEETEAEPPRPVLIRALISLLQTQNELESVVRRLEKRLASAELLTVHRK
ncbi:TetR/AcrR family transcriptional regulator [Paenibacillus silvisoli]|uniref:TetR/AcrR family transcriptional regulator n=1 Tax=Paenibacillus silvisoli TaxID=3110539 RepID=UPI0028054672|nr:helix-turn-helix domain-containing protein [Paenibacillus silvisoli]